MDWSKDSKKNHGLIKDEGLYRIRRNKELYQQIESIFYGSLVEMDN